MGWEFREHGAEQNTLTQEGDDIIGLQKFRNEEMHNWYSLSDISFLNLRKADPYGRGV